MKIFSIAFRCSSGIIRGTNFEHKDSSAVYKSPLNTAIFNGSSVAQASLARPIAEGIMSLYDGSLNAVGVTDRGGIYCELTTVNSQKTYQILYENYAMQIYSKDYDIKVDDNVVTRHYFVPLLVKSIIDKKNMDLCLSLEGLKAVVEKNGIPLDNKDDETQKYFFLSNDHFYFEYKDNDYVIFTEPISMVNVVDDITPVITGYVGDYSYINFTGNPSGITPSGRNNGRKTTPPKKKPSEEEYNIVKMDFGEPLPDDMIEKIPTYTMFPAYMQIPQEMYSCSESVAYGDSISVFLYGPTGTGKTTNAKLLCRDIGLPVMAVVNCTDALDEFILGKFVPRGSEFVFFESEVTEAIRWGGAAIFEEFLFANPKHLAFLNSLLDDNGFVRLDNGETVRRHENFRFFVTTNVGYAGLNDGNISLFNRFDEQIYLKDMSKEVIRTSLLEKFDLSDDIIKDIIKVYDKIKIKIDEEKLDTAITLRNLERWAKKINRRPQTPYKGAITTVINPVSKFDDDLAEEISDIVKSVFPK